MRFFYLTIVLLLLFTSLGINAQEEIFTFCGDCYSPEGEIDKNIKERKKGSKGSKKGGKKGGDITTDTLGPDDFNEFYPEHNEVLNGPVAPPLFPCDPPICTVLRDILPASECENKCEKGSHCQGRKDTRIGEKNIAVCVPNN